MVVNDQSRDWTAVENSSRRERKKAEARRRIYAAALDLFRTQGYEATTVQQIADEADVGKATFFNYFPSKEYVLGAYHDEMTADVLATLERRRHRSAQRAVETALHECARWVETDLAMARIVVRHFFSSEVLLERDAANEARFVDWFRGQIESGIESGELRRDLDVGLFLSLVVAVLSSSVQEWVTADRPFDLKRSLSKKLEFLFRAAKDS